MLKKIQLSLITIILPLLLNAYIFEVDKTHSVIFLTTSLTVDLANNYFDRQIFEQPTEQELEKLDKDDIPFFDSWSATEHDSKFKFYSDLSVYCTISSALFIIYEPDKSVLLNNLTVFSEIMIAQSAIAKWSKTFSQRYRPFVYNQDTSLAKKQQRNSRHSFYSMHSSTAFSAATFAYYYYSQNFGRNYLTASLLFGSAAATAYFRAASGQHFPSDVAAGAIIGSAVSYFICKYHNKDKPSLRLGFNSIELSFKF